MNGLLFDAIDFNDKSAKKKDTPEVKLEACPQCGRKAKIERFDNGEFLAVHGSTWKKVKTQTGGQVECEVCDLCHGFQKAS